MPLHTTVARNPKRSQATALQSAARRDTIVRLRLRPMWRCHGLLQYRPFRAWKGIKACLSRLDSAMPFELSRIAFSQKKVTFFPKNRSLRAQIILQLPHSVHLFSLEMDTMGRTDIYNNKNFPPLSYFPLFSVLSRRLCALCGKILSPILSHAHSHVKFFSK